MKSAASNMQTNPLNSIQLVCKTATENIWKTILRFEHTDYLATADVCRYINTEPDDPCLHNMFLYLGSLRQRLCLLESDISCDERRSNQLSRKNPATVIPSRYDMRLIRICIKMCDSAINDLANLK